MEKQVWEGKIKVFCLGNLEFKYLRKRDIINITVTLLLEYGNPII